MADLPLEEDWALAEIRFVRTIIETTWDNADALKPSTLVASLFSCAISTALILGFTQRGVAGWLRYMADGVEAGAYGPGAAGSDGRH